MALSNYLADIWGISIVIFSFALLIKDTHVKKIFAAIEREEGMFMWGLMSVVVGIAIVLAHNLWVKDWQVLVTILGWLSLVKGALFMFFPEFIRRVAKNMENSKYLPIGLVVAVFIGLVLTYFGFKG